MKKGGKHCRRRWGALKKNKIENSPNVRLPSVTPVGLDGQKKHAAKCNPLNTLQSKAHVSP